MPSPSAPKPDIKFDIDALFDHLENTLGQGPGDEMDWHFSFGAQDLARLERIADELSEEFEVDLQEEVETHVNGRRVMGPPMLSVIVRGALGPADVKPLAERFKALAATQRVTYQGVACFDPMDGEEGGWLELEDARDQLRHFADNGMPADEPLKYIFCLMAQDETHAERIGDQLAEAGFPDVEVVSDATNEWAAIVHVDGSGDEANLSAEFGRVAKVAKASKAEMLGVQLEPAEDGDEEYEDDDEGEDDEAAPPAPPKKR